MRTWPLLILAPAVPVFALLVLHSVWWTFALYHLGVCLLLPAAVSAGRRRGWTRHLEDVGLRAAPGKVQPSSSGAGIGLALGLLLGGGTVAAFALWHEPFLAGQDIPGVLSSWGVTPKLAVLMLSFMVLGNGACEELFWRGWIHRRLESRPRRRTVLALTAAAYTSYHLVTVASFVGSAAVVALFVAVIFGAGLFFGWLREKFGTVWAPLLVHTGATAGYMAVYLIWVAEH